VLRWLTGTPGRRLEFDVTDATSLTESATGDGRTPAAGPGVDLDGLVRVVIERVETLTRAVGNRDERLGAEEAARQRAGEELRLAIEAGDRAQEELTHRTAGGGLRKQIAGAILVLLGIVLQGWLIALGQ
jgi:hypothetical protein